MKFNLKHLSPICLSSLFTGISFIIFLIIFLISKPSFITEISDDKIVKINYYLLLSYSLMFSILIGLFVIFYKVNGSNKNDTVKLSFGPSSIQKINNPIEYTPYIFADYNIPVDEPE